MELTPAEKNLKNLLQTWMLILGSAGVFFLFFGNQLLISINKVSTRFFPKLPLINEPSEFFWLTLTLSLMVVLIFLCYWAQKDIRRNIDFVIPFLISKFVSTFFFFVFYFKQGYSLAYLVGVISDGSMFLITFYFYKKVKWET
ncbi:MAG TPA: hypothetical protein DDW49_06030 [Deltaproteobacteria bacterium]|nr:MAG: hypothetical protein A2048_07705 [Deltaproteobacteria bacterium GWA2_45_12]HBF12931.1 hypothetical protein [Deltaproteobacteria bacterium]